MEFSTDARCADWGEASPDRVSMKFLGGLSSWINWLMFSGVSITSVKAEVPVIPVQGKQESNPQAADLPTGAEAATESRSVLWARSISPICITHLSG
jgi:hypothetical protein